MPNNETSPISQAVGNQTLKEVTQPVIHESRIPGILRGEIPRNVIPIQSPEDVVAALKSGDPTRMTGAASVIQELQGGLQGDGKRAAVPKTDEKASAVLEEARRTGRLGELEVREDVDNSRVLHIKDPVLNTEIRHIPGQPLEAVASMESEEEVTPIEKLLEERKTAWELLMAEIPDWSETAMGKKAYEGRIGSIDKKIGEIVADATKRIGLREADLIEDLVTFRSKVGDEIRLQISIDRRFAKDQNAMDSLAYLLARAGNRDAESDPDPSLPAEPQPWEWRSPETERRRDRSEFEQVVDNIDDLFRLNPGITEADHRIIEQRRKIDALLREANKIEVAEGKRFYDPVKQELTDMYFHARVKVTREMKEGSDPYSRGGKLQELALRRNEARKEGNDSWEVRSGFWLDPARRVHESRLRGSANYINAQGTDVVTEVVRNRKRYQRDGDPYPPAARGVVEIWDGVVRTNAGPIIDEETGNPVVAKSFDDVREAIEEQRRMEPLAASSAYDPVTPFRFVADDKEELLEMVPYMIRKVNLRIDPTQPQGAENELNQEVNNLIKTLSVFPNLSKRWLRRIRSKISAEFAKSAAYEASSGVRKGWDAYIHFLQRLASGTEDKEGLAGGDHIVDSLFLDREGHTMSILEALCAQDGKYWRYRLQLTDTPIKTKDKSANYKLQGEDRRRIVEFEMSHRLKPMWKLLGLPPPPDASPGSVTEPIHPAFARLKKKLDRLDGMDAGHIASGKAIVVIADEKGDYRILTDDELDQIGQKEKFLVVLDIDGRVTPRWDEYCRKAMEWQRTGEFGDTENPGRIIFQHPLSRSLRPQGFQAKGEPETPIDELELMYEADDRVATDKWYAKAKRRKITESMDRARKVARAFMIDSEAALSWHTFPNEKVLAEANKYLALIGERQRTLEESVPYKTLYRAMMQAIINEDRKKPLKDRQLIWHSLLTEHWGIDLDLPQMALWRLGAHDGLRAVLLDKMDSSEDPEVRELRQMVVDSAREGGPDEKNIMTAWAENERRIGILLDIVMKAKFGTKGGSTGAYFNQAGHDDRDAGVKDIRNLLRLIYGQSSNTVRLNGLIPVLGHLGGGTFGRDMGGTRSPIRQLVGGYKCEDEVAYMETGYTGYIESPRDMEDGVGRLEKMTKQQKALTSEADDSPGIWVKGPFSGMFEWRAFMRNTDLFKHSPEHRGKHLEENYAIADPHGAFRDLKEAVVAEMTKKGASVAAPLAKFLRGNIDSTFGLNPQSRLWLNTFHWLGTSIWMDTNREFRKAEGPAYALDGNLPLPRLFMHTALLDDGLIMEDTHWDRIMLGTVEVFDDNDVSKPASKRKKRTVIRYKVDGTGGVQDYQETRTTLENGSHKIVLTPDLSFSGENIPPSEIAETTMGLLDVFPNDLRDEIIKNDWIPMGLNSYYPETLKILKGEGDINKEYYEPAMAHIRPRTRVNRPLTGPY